MRKIEMRELEKVMTDFLLHCRVEKNLSSHTLKAYQLDLNQFFTYLSVKGKVMDMKKIDKQILRDYLQQLQETNKVKTVKRKIATLKALFTYLEFEDRIEVSPFRKMRIKIKEPLQLPGVLTLNEIKTLFRTVYKVRRACSDSTIYTYKSIVRDIVVLELLFATGIRVSELCNLKKVDVNIEQKYIQVNGKGSRERMIQVCSQEIIDVIDEYMELFHSPGGNFSYFFVNRLGHRLSEQSVRFMIKKYTRLSNINKEVTPHMFRHTFATLLLEEEVDIRYIQQLLGHSTITTTQIYTHITQHKQKEILSTRHPRGSFKVVE
ncbi:MAG: tyrosine-type recombinase/integrase [Candidatus Aminicenantes bacterium]|nr:MAG: tyrosine-type recombinase/integrase [Candidatus Aminicenantes bacterium]